jgi:hypothetical protein
MIEIFYSIFQEYNSLIKYAGIALIFFYFVENWQFSRILIYLLVLVAVIIFMNADKFSHLMKPESNKPLEVAENPVITAKIPEIRELPAELQQLNRYINEIKEGVDDPSYSLVISSIDVLFISYNNQVDKLFDDFKNSRGFYHLTFQNIKDIEATIYEQIQALYYKVEADQYMEVAQRLHSIELIMEKIDGKMEQIINADFKANITCNKNMVSKLGVPIGRTAGE